MKATAQSVLFSALLFLAGAFPASADTAVSGTIQESAVWSADNSPYVLEGAVRVEAGATLTIEPGVEVISSGGVRRITVEGEFIAGALNGEQVTLADIELSLSGGSVRVQNGIIQLTDSGTSGTLLNAPMGSLHLENVRIVAPGVQYPVFFTGETLFTHSSTTIEGAIVNGFMTAGEFYGDVVWTADHTPYVVDSVLDVYGTLTIEAGTVVKGYFNPLISNYGTLVVEGAPEAPVYFTSIADDSIGGDTNGDGSTTAPAAGDWSGLVNYAGGAVQMSNTVVRYAEAGFTDTGGAISISDSVFENNKTGVIAFDFEVGSVFANNTIAGNGPAAPAAGVVWSGSGSDQFDARNNWWGDASGPYHSTLNPDGLGDSVSDKVLFEPWLTAPPGEEPEPEVLDPVIIIPGILGSWEKNGEWVIDPLFGVYNDLVGTLAANDYTEGKDLFTFPYNWRESNVETALLLQEKINKVQEICGCDKVDLVAHSMGGLVARQYIQSDVYENDVDQMIFLGTPHLGAPKSYWMWETGKQVEDFTDIFDDLFDIIFKNEARKNGFSNVFDYIRLRPVLSVQELLPTFSYLRDDDSLALREYPTGYPRNLFLEQLNTNKDTLLERVEVVNVVGEVPNDTINEYIVAPTDELPEWEHGEPVEGGVVKGDGDGTVPFVSSASVEPTFLNVEAEHAELVSFGASEVYFLLTGEDPSAVISEGFDIDVPFLLLQLFSPVDMQIIAPDGKRLGKEFQSGEEVNEIPNAFYSGFNGENEYAIILNPLPGDYEIKTVGTGAGSYTVVADYSDLATTHSTEVTKEVAEGQEDIHQLVFNDESGVFELLRTPEEEVVIEEPPVEEEITTGGGGSGGRSSGRVLGASTSRFTPEQIEAILGLLRAFGVSEDVVVKVAAFL